MVAFSVLWNVYESTAKRCLARIGATLGGAPLGIQPLLELQSRHLGSEIQENSVKPIAFRIVDFKSIKDSGICELSSI